MLECSVRVRMTRVMHLADPSVCSNRGRSTPTLSPIVSQLGRSSPGYEHWRSSSDPGAIRAPAGVALEVRADRIFRTLSRGINATRRTRTRSKRLRSRNELLGRRSPPVSWRRSMKRTRTKTRISHTNTRKSSSHPGNRSPRRCSSRSGLSLQASPTGTNPRRDPWMGTLPRPIKSDCFADRSTRAMFQTSPHISTSGNHHRNMVQPATAIRSHSTLSQQEPSSRRSFPRFQIVHCSKSTRTISRKAA